MPTGARLMRSWNGQTYVVETAEDGTIRWNNREWRSLSEVARAIVEQIIAGRQPAKLDARKLTLSGELPMRWNRQRTFAGFSTTR